MRLGEASARALGGSGAARGPSSGALSPAAPGGVLPGGMGGGVALQLQGGEGGDASPGSPSRQRGNYLGAAAKAQRALQGGGALAGLGAGGAGGMGGMGGAQPLSGSLSPGMRPTASPARGVPAMAPLGAALPALPAELASLREQYAGKALKKALRYIYIYKDPCS